MLRSSAVALRVLLAAACVPCAACSSCRRDAARDADGGPAAVASKLAVNEADGADAGSAGVAPGDRTLRVVGESLLIDKTHATSDGRFVVSAGPLLYEGRADGSLVSVASPSTYASFVPEEESLVGYVSEARSPLLVIGTGHGGYQTFFGYGPEPRSFRVESGKLEGSPAHVNDKAAVWWHGTLVAIDSDTRALAVAEGQATPPPSGASEYVLDDLGIASDGALLAIARSKKTSAPTSLLWRSPSEPPSAALIPVPSLEGLAHCAVVRAYDGATYTRCSPRSITGPRATFYKWTGSSWQQVFADTEALGSNTSVASDGALYANKQSSIEIVRCAPQRPCEAVAHDPWVTSGGGATYGHVPTDLYREGQGYWQSVRVDRTPKDVRADRIDQLVARTPTDVWVSAVAGGVRLLIHSGPPRDRSYLPSPLDAQVLVRNEKPPTTWVGHCEQLFIRLAGARGDAGLDVEAVTRKLPELKTMLTPPIRQEDYNGPPYDWALVEGTLADERVVGAVVYRLDGEGTAAAMERAVETFVSKVATNPMSKPEVSCTLPVLKRRLGP